MTTIPEHAKGGIVSGDTSAPAPDSGFPRGLGALSILYAVMSGIEMDDTKRKAKAEREQDAK